jgi:hypothetical protein
MGPIPIKNTPLVVGVGLCSLPHTETTAMAMTKKEALEMADLRKALAEAKALRFPTYRVVPPMTREEILAGLVDGDMRYGSPQKVTPGWFYNGHNDDVRLGCSNGSGHDSWNSRATSSQGMGRMYRTKLEALRNLRLDVTQICAERLAKIDRWIAEEEESE